MAEAENAKEIEPATAADGPQQQQAGGIRQRIRSLLKRKDRQKQQKERPDDAVKLGCGGLFRRKKRAEAGDQESQKPAEKPKKSGKGGEVKEEEKQEVELQPQPQQPDAASASAAEPETSALEQPASKAPARPENPPRPLVELAAKSAPQPDEDVNEKTEENAAEENAAEENAAEENAAEENAAKENAAEEDKTTVQNGHALESEPESENQRHEEAERQFQQASVDMADVTPKPGVTIEQGPHTEIWSSIINKSFIGTGAFKRAAVCSLESGAVLACNPADFTPTVQQVAVLRENFDCRSGLSAAGFGLADTVYSLLDEAGTKDILCGSDESRGQTLLVCKTKTALLAAACQGAPDRAADMLGDMRQHFISQGM
ncbi:hypothetical protein BOX15_Mlig008644g1 [Macrostomum lignano]|uniref:Profilin n=1 Tax=Macrostomum lignano TaxID=282301 RepID=A0A267GDR0_9PLAT|nr:hypothetical protein BOX15_Mlig008644g1 [Macrostomum lignano]